jgi:hypothetical protein
MLANQGITVYASVNFYLRRFYLLPLWLYRLAETTDVKESGICIKFWFKRCNMAAKTHKMLKEAFGDMLLA